MIRMLKALIIVISVLVCIVAPVFASPNWITMDEKPTLIYQIDAEAVVFSGEDSDKQLEIWMKTLQKDGTGSYMVAHYLVKENGLSFILKERTMNSATGVVISSFQNTSDKWSVTTPSSPIGSSATRIFAEYRRNPEGFNLKALSNNLATAPEAKAKDTNRLSAGITVKADPQLSPDVVDKAKMVVEETREFYEHKYGVTLSSPIEVLMVANKENYRKALMEVFKLTPSAADKWAAHTNGISQGNGVITSALNKGAPTWVYYALLCHELTHNYQRQLAPGMPPGKMSWLWEGMADMVSAQIMADKGVQTLAQTRKTWLDYMRKQPNRPLDVKVLGNQSQWFKAEETYGDVTVIHFAGLAVDYLVQQKGYNPLFDYVRLAATTDGPSAFVTAFGMTLDQFSADFQSYINEKLAK
ncbi:hypothetical protein AXX12_14115 [Anaerosporomusa subterranea]|uniref:Peptidase MA-like domain-containing protein n=1 Tax=Anaerosporomusa subterranea TaxID=1794912 RepID=A0A154BMX9_ANASB|nr:hypothetical protein [Anaerosporomusa subterranea]KYZ75289.1 hypothetical protein AXX12_14115 [Anaerosporomusa subterranea]